MEMNIREILATSPVMPVIVADTVEAGVAIARALSSGGIRLVEITLRTAQSLNIIRAICSELPEVVVGAGTLTRPGDFAAAAKAGALFGVSPGHTPALLNEARQCGMPFLPGVMTPSDILLARDSGFTVMKLFPARPSGGIDMLKALAGPLPDISFCPTGGIHPQDAAEFLALDNVLCVGGSWLAPQDLIARRDWQAITTLARQAANLRAAA